MLAALMLLGHTATENDAEAPERAPFSFVACIVTSRLVHSLIAFARNLSGYEVTNALRGVFYACSF